MSDELLPAAPIDSFGGTQLQPWQPTPELPALAKSPIERPLAAIRRYKWLMLAIIILSAGAGVAATRLLTPQYEVQGKIMIPGQSPMESSQRIGPIRSAELFSADDWAGLLRSFAITDDIVRELSLYLRIDNPKVNTELFKGFGLAQSYATGEYELTIDRTRKRWTLVSESVGALVDSGTVADSLGRRVGFQWRLDPVVFNGTGDRTARFTVATPREAAVDLINRLNTSRQDKSNFLRLTLQDPDPQVAARIVNLWVRRFVDFASALKKRKLVDYTNTLEDQFRTAKRALDSSEVALSSYRVRTITQGGEGGVPIAAGIQETRDPVMRDFFTRKIDYEDLKHDIGLLQRLIASAAKDSIPSDAFLDIKSAANSPETATLRTAIAEFHTAENNLAQQRTALTDEHPAVQAIVAQMTSLRKAKIPGYANDLLTSLKMRAADDSVRIAAAGENLQKIPERTIEEERLTRIRDVNAGLAGQLQTRLSEAQLAEASASPDVTVLDSAIAPLQPTKDTAPKLILGAVGGGIGLALVLAILLDRLDGRLRYPEQATDDLGLPIAGTVPRFPKGGVSQDSPDQMFQLVESFRSLRMSVMQANPTQGAVSVAVSSPSPNEGKSLIAANLAMSFADAGLRTILVDGDTRRGALHDLFGVSNSPGLTDLLAGTTTTTEAIQQTPHDSLFVLPCGKRRRRSPELLTSVRLPQLVAELRSSFDVVIFDTPPLAAGIDGYSIATATGSLLVVLRVGSTARRMAGEKLRLFERLPVEIVGAVLNGIDFSAGYGYYGYVPGYEAVEESDSTDVVSTR
jgi:capsular exopolysaccharide synthesis family protein